MLYPQFRRNVRILLLGEPSVGKTSIVLSLVSEEFPGGESNDEELPPRSEEITIPADVTPEFVPTTIVDYSAREQSESDLAIEISKAHVICVVYAVNDDDSLEKVTSYWLPTIGKILEETAIVPVILVGNKIDLVDYTTMDIVVPLMSEWPEIETCIECSAKTLRNISELFFYAQKAVLHPTRPIYDCDTKQLTQLCKQALERIFVICDNNNDGLLDDMEMYHFQKTCYDAPLQPAALDSVKLIIQQYCQNGVKNSGITLEGFLTLHTIFVQRGKHETTWTALRKFGYNDRLVICNDYLCPIVNIPIGFTAELNQNGLDFFTHVFVKYDVDRDRCLNPTEMESMFKICPQPPPWIQNYKGLVPTNPLNSYLSYNGFICGWALNTLLDLNSTMEYMAYLGLTIDENGGQNKAINVVGREGKKNVFKCHLIGGLGVGKTTICKNFIGQKPPTGNQEKIPMIEGGSQQQQHPINTQNYVINIVQVYGQDKYLAIQDIDLARVVDYLPTSEVLCDVVCLVYDTSDPKSFEFIARTYLNYYATLKIPTLIVGNKTDLGTQLQEYIYQPAAFCSKYKLSPPHFISATEEKTSRELYIKLATMAAFPKFQPAWMLFYHGGSKLGLTNSSTSSIKRWLSSIGLGLVLVTSVFFITSRIWPSSSSSAPSSSAATKFKRF